MAWRGSHSKPWRREKQSKHIRYIIILICPQVLIQEPENDYRYDFTGGEHLATDLRVVLAQKHVVFSSKKYFTGTGLPNCFLEGPRITIAETAIHQDGSFQLTSCMVFRDVGDNPYVYIFGGLSRPTGNDAYLNFLGGQLKVRDFI
jgi:hypothetical protein